MSVYGGDVTGNGTLNWTTSTFMVDGTGNFGGTSAWNFYNLTFGNGSGAETVTATGTATATISHFLTISSSQTLNAGFKVWSINGYSTTSVPFVINGTFTASSSTFRYTTDQDTNITATTYYNLELVDPPANENQVSNIPGGEQFPYWAGKIQNSNLTTQALSLNIKEKPEHLKITDMGNNKYELKTLDNSVIKIGTEKHSFSEPYINLTKWDGEVSLKIGIPFETGNAPQIIGDKLRYSTADKPLAKKSLWQKISEKLFGVKVGDNQPKIDIDIYSRQPEKIKETINGKEYAFTQNEQGGIEFDTILYEKPNTNQIIFPIETKGLRFLYQPPLNQEQQEAGLTCTETTCYDENGTVTTFRPENVAGSYAVYHSGNPINYVGGKEYKTGKAFHIYRPKVNDSAGNEIWGKLNIEAGLFSEGLAEEGILSITIDQDWLDNAVYPVTIDPEFGYHANGLSVYNIWDYLYAYNYTGGAGTISSFSAYYDDSVGKLHIILYDASNRIDYGAERTINGGNALDWYTDNAVVGATISAQTYYMGFYTDSGSDWYYDTDDTGHNQYEAVAYSSPPPATWSKTQSTAHRKFSIYCTYTAWQPRPGLISPSGGGFLIF